MAGGAVPAPNIGFRETILQGQIKVGQFVLAKGLGVVDHQSYQAQQQHASLGEQSCRVGGDPVPILFGRSLGGFSTVVVSANKTLLTGACQRANQEFELPGKMTTILEHY